MGFTLKQDGFASYTSIPNCFIEQFMPYAAGEFVKIYIYLLKCVGENQADLSISKIADAFNNTEKDVVRALKYWQKKGLLKLTFDDNNALTSLCMVSLTDVQEMSEAPVPTKMVLSVTDAPIPGQPGINTKPAKKEKPEVPSMQTLIHREILESEDEVKAVKPKVKTPSKKNYSVDEISSFTEQEEITQLFYIIQKYIGKTLSGTDINTFLYMYDGLHFSVELIEYLVEYCVSRDHADTRYMEKVALGWASDGISTVDGAKTLGGIYSEDGYKILNAFGLENRKLTKGESEFLYRWTVSYEFPMNIILKACEKTMNRLHKASFEYTDTILKDWKINNISSLEEIRKHDEAYEQAAAAKKQQSFKQMNPNASKTKFNNFKQQNYDFELMNSMALNNKR